MPCHTMSHHVAAVALYFVMPDGIEEQVSHHRSSLTLLRLCYGCATVVLRLRSRPAFVPCRKRPPRGPPPRVRLAPLQLRRPQGGPRRRGRLPEEGEGRAVRRGLLPGAHRPGPRNALPHALTRAKRRGADTLSEGNNVDFEGQRVRTDLVTTPSQSHCMTWTVSFQVARLFSHCPSSVRSDRVSNPVRVGNVILSGWVRRETYQNNRSVRNSKFRVWIKSSEPGSGVRCSLETPETPAELCADRHIVKQCVIILTLETRLQKYNLPSRRREHGQVSRSVAGA